MKFRLGAALLGAAVAVGSLTLFANSRKPVNSILDTTTPPVLKTGYTNTNGPSVQPVDFEHAASVAVPAVVHIKTLTKFNATAGQPGFVVDDREVRKEGPSYSVETLGELRHEYPDRSICLIVGMDAFLSLPKWHQWQELLQLAHLVVAHRPGWRAPGMGPLGELLVDHGTGRIGDLHEQRAGCIYIHAVTQLEISSTEVRQLIAMGRDPRFLMPDAVRKLILETNCYSKTRTT